MRIRHRALRIVCTNVGVALTTWLQEWDEDRCLELGPDANMPLWDGTRADYDSAVLAMLAM